MIIDNHMHKCTVSNVKLKILKISNILAYKLNIISDIWLFRLYFVYIHYLHKKYYSFKKVKWKIHLNWVLSNIAL